MNEYNWSKNEKREKRDVFHVGYMHSAALMAFKHICWSDLLWEATYSYCALPPSILLFFILFYSILPHQFWISCPSWWCHILWSLPAWRRPPFQWRWARWTDWARWLAWPTWRSSTPSPLPGLPPPSLRWTQRPISPVDLTTSQSRCDTRDLLKWNQSFNYIEVLF